MFKMNKNIDEKWYLDFITYMSKKYNDEVCIVNGTMNTECDVYEYQNGEC